MPSYYWPSGPRPLVIRTEKSYTIFARSTYLGVLALIWKNQGDSISKETKLHHKEILNQENLNRIQKKFQIWKLK